MTKGVSPGGSVAGFDRIPLMTGATQSLQAVFEEAALNPGLWHLKVLSTACMTPRMLGRATLTIDGPETVPRAAVLTKWTGVLTETPIGQEVLAMFCRFLCYGHGIRQVKGDFLCLGIEEANRLQQFFEANTGWIIIRPGQKRVTLEGRVGFWGDLT